jgi:nitric oxide reductase activation protein
VIGKSVNVLGDHVFLFHVPSSASMDAKWNEFEQKVVSAKLDDGSLKAYAVVPDTVRDTREGFTAEERQLTDNIIDRVKEKLSALTGNSPTIKVHAMTAADRKGVPHGEMSVDRYK